MSPTINPMLIDNDDISNGGGVREIESIEITANNRHISITER